MFTRLTARGAVTLLVVLLALSGACAKKQPPIARPMPPPPPDSTTATPPPEPPEPVQEPGGVPPEPVPEDSILSGSIDDINRNSPLQPAFFALDSSEIDATAQRALEHNAEMLKKYSNFQISIEGHADERGTAEYNLALGERRAVSARNYLVSLGISADRVKIVSYGKEFPFDPGHNEEAWAKNRRAHFVVTAK
jgi:peptidoglycan-associated lipoprotein